MSFKKVVGSKCQPVGGQLATWMLQRSRGSWLVGADYIKDSFESTAGRNVSPVAGG